MGRNEGAVKALAHRGLVGLRASMANDARPVAPPREAVPDPLDRARHAVAEVRLEPGRPGPAAGPGAAAGPVAHRRPDRRTSTRSRQDLALTAEGGAP